MKKRMLAFALVLSMLFGMCTGIPMSVYAKEANEYEVAMVAAGDGYTMVLTKNGEVWAWGSNSHGLLGDGTARRRLKPVKINITGVKQIAAGDYHTVAVKENGEVWAWGYNNYGQLGDGTTVDRWSPVKINIMGVKQVAVGMFYTVALKENGEVWAWGRDESGQLGDGIKAAASAVTPIKSDIDGVKQISSGTTHVVALKENGEVWAWGGNYWESIGDGTSVDRWSPVKIDIDGVKQIVAGDFHTVALKENGEVFVWGFSRYENDNTLAGRLTHKKVDIDGVKQISADDSTVILKENGEVWGWGKNNGALGGDPATDHPTPVKIDITGVKQVSVGEHHTVVLKENGEVWTWGSNSSGQLGIGTTTSSYTPVQVKFGPSNFVEGDITTQYRSDFLECNKDLTFFYSDRFFGELDGGAYNHDLAKASLALELSAWTAHGADGGGESAKMSNISNLYRSLKFDEKSIQSYNYGESLNDNSDKVAYSFATKELYDGSTLVAVVVRGGGYGAEWRSNFHVGSGDMHYGFGLPALNVYADLLEYTKDMDKSKLKLWVTGYSRGAAVANIVAGKINEDNLVAGDNLYAYTFATPNGVKVAETGANSSIHNNIYNIVLPYDFIPTLAFEKWDYGRYGKTLRVKDVPWNLSEYQQGGHEKYFREFTGRVYTMGPGFSKAARKAADAICNFAGSQKEYVTVWQGFFMDVVEWALCRSEEEDLSEFINKRYSVSTATWREMRNLATDYIVHSKNLIKFVGNDKIRLEDVICLMHLNGIDVYNNLYDNLYGKISKAVYDIGFSLSDVGGIFEAHNPEYYIAWLYGYDDPNAIYQSAPYNIVTVACPVDVNVYDANGELVASIVNNEVVVDTLPVEIVGESAEIYLYEDENIDDYTIEVEAYADGNVNYSVTEYTNDGTEKRKINYADIPVVTGTKLSGAVPKGQQLAAESYNLTSVTDGKETTVAYTEDLSGEELQNLTVNVTVEGAGTANSIYYATKGELVTLEAKPYFDASFIGWYDESGKLISTELTHSYVLRESMNVTAKFTKCTALRFTNVPQITDNQLSVQSAVSSAKDTSGMHIVAVYSDDDKLLGTKITPASLNANSEIEVDVNFDVSAFSIKPAYVRLYLWNNFFSLQNMCEEKMLEIW